MVQKQSQTVIVNIGKTKAKGRRKGKGKPRGKKTGLVASFMPNSGLSSGSISHPMGKPQSLEQSLFNNTMPRTIPLISQLGYPALTNNFQPQSSSSQDRLAYQGLLTQQPTIDIAGSKPTSNIATNILSGNADAPEVLTPTKRVRGPNKPKMEVIGESGITTPLKKTPAKKKS